LKLDYVMWFPSKSLEVGRVCLANIFKVAKSAQPPQEYVALAGAEHNLYVVEKACRIANLPENRRKNRYANVIPYDDCVVVLPDSTYVNASRICGVDKNCNSVSTAYIATQGPLDTTVDDFYRMILEYNVGIIVMLTALIEGDQVKCHRYWPPCSAVYNVDDSDVAHATKLHDMEDLVDLGAQNDFFMPRLPRGSRSEIACPSFGAHKPLDDKLELDSVVVIGVEEFIMGPIIKRVLHVFEKSDISHKNPHRLVQFQFKGWPDHGVPNNARLIRKIVHMVEEERVSDTVPRPIVVHCSAGLGRTGTFIAIHQNIIKMKEAFGKEEKPDPKDYYINLYQDILQMRGCRSGMVQQPGQYIFCYKAIAEEAYEMGIVNPDGVDLDEFYGEEKKTPNLLTVPVGRQLRPFQEGGSQDIQIQRSLAQSSRSALFESHAENDDDDDDVMEVDDDINPLSLSRSSNRSTSGSWTFPPSFP